MHSEKEKMKCIHCGLTYTQDELVSQIIIETKGVRITDYFCLNTSCNKVMHGCTKVEKIK